MSVGELLAHARVARGLTLQDPVRGHRSSRVSALDAMEHDDFRHVRWNRIRPRTAQVAGTHAGARPRWTHLRVLPGSPPHARRL